MPGPRSAPGCSRCCCSSHICRGRPSVRWADPAWTGLCAQEQYKGCHVNPPDNCPLGRASAQGADAKADQAAGAGSSPRPSSRRRRPPKIAASSDCGGGAAADSADAPPPAAAAAARRSMVASESPGMSGRLEGRSQGWAVLLVLLTMIGCIGASEEDGGVGGCMPVHARTPQSPKCLSMCLSFQRHADQVLSTCHADKFRAFRRA